MEFDLIVAIVARLRASSAISTAVGGRFFSSANVPVDAAFPRCYIDILKRQPDWVRFPVADGGYDRTVFVEILFGTTSTVTPLNAEQFVTSIDKLAFAQLDMAVTLTDLVSFRRVASIPAYDQNDDRTSYLMCGGRYAAHFQHG